MVELSTKSHLVFETSHLYMDILLARYTFTQKLLKNLCSAERKVAIYVLDFATSDTNCKRTENFMCQQISFASTHLFR